MCEDCQKVALKLNDVAGECLMEGDFMVASVLLALASQFTLTESGARVLARRSVEARALAKTAGQVH